jgi:phage-related protein
MAIIWIDIMTLITGQNAEAVMQDIMFYFRKIITEFATFFQTIGDIMYKLVMESGKFSAALKQIIISMCEFLKTIFIGVIQPFICAIREQISMVFDMISSIISFVNTMTFGSIDGVSDQIDNARDAMRDAIDCDGPNPFHC